MDIKETRIIGKRVRMMFNPDLANLSSIEITEVLPDADSGERLTTTLEAIPEGTRVEVTIRILEE